MENAVGCAHGAVQPILDIPCLIPLKVALIII